MSGFWNSFKNGACRFLPLSVWRICTTRQIKCRILQTYRLIWPGSSDRWKAPFVCFTTPQSGRKKCNKYWSIAVLQAISLNTFIKLYKKIKVILQAVSCIHLFSCCLMITFFPSMIPFLYFSSQVICRQSVSKLLVNCKEGKVSLSHTCPCACRSTLRRSISALSSLISFTLGSLKTIEPNL